MKERFKHDYGLRNNYQFYKEKYNNALEYKVFSDVINAFNNQLIDQIYKGAYITLPYNLGDLFIFKWKPKIKFNENGEVTNTNVRAYVDYKATNELWKEHPELAHKQRVYYDNLHTDRYKFRITWKRYHTLRAHRLYNFLPSRQFKRGLAHYLKENTNHNYYGK